MATSDLKYYRWRHSARMLVIKNNQSNRYISLFAEGRAYLTSNPSKSSAEWTELTYSDVASFIYQLYKYGWVESYEFNKYVQDMIVHHVRKERGI
jgi:hypothetical protein